MMFYKNAPLKRTGTLHSGIRFFVVAIALSIVLPASAQTIDDIREEFSQELSEANFASGFGGLIFLSDELELSGAHYEIDNGDEGGFSDTKLSAIALPFHRSFRPWEESVAGIYLEGVAGYGSGERSIDDLYGGAFPALATSVDAEWRTYGGLIGLGPEFVVNEGLTIAPILNAGLARIEMDGDYDGVGADTTAQILDGIAFNWEGWTASWGGALRVDWVRPLTESGITLETVARYDIRWLEAFATDDRAQEFESRLQLLTLRADLVGPTGVDLFGRDLYWRAITSYRCFLEEDLHGVRNLGMVGGGLELDVKDVLPFGDRLSVKGGVIVGEDLLGYTVGLSLSL